MCKYPRTTKDKQKLSKALYIYNVSKRLAVHNDQQQFQSCQNCLIYLKPLMMIPVKKGKNIKKQQRYSNNSKLYRYLYIDIQRGRVNRTRSADTFIFSVARFNHYLKVSCFFRDQLGLIYIYLQPICSRQIRFMPNFKRSNILLDYNLYITILPILPNKDD